MFPQKKGTSKCLLSGKKCYHVRTVEIMGMFSPFLYGGRQGVPSGPAPTALTTPEVIAHLFCHVRDCFSRALHCLVSQLSPSIFGDGSSRIRRPCLYALVPILSRQLCSFWTKKIYILFQILFWYIFNCVQPLRVVTWVPFPAPFTFRWPAVWVLPGREGASERQSWQVPLAQGQGGHPIRCKNLYKGHWG